MPLQLSQNFHNLLWGSQNDGSSQDQQTQNDLCKSQNETSWQNDTQLSQSLIGNLNSEAKPEIPFNRTYEGPSMNQNRRDSISMLSQMPLASASNMNAFSARLRPEERTSSKYTMPNWARGVRGGNTAGNTSNSQPQTYGQSSSTLQNSIQTKRMEAQQRDVKEYLMTLVNSIDKLKKAFGLGVVESSVHMEQFVTNVIDAKFDENNKQLNADLEKKFNAVNECLKKFPALEYSEVLKSMGDKIDLMKKYCVDEAEKTQQLHRSVNENMNLLGQMQNQISCLYEVLETLREDKVQKEMAQNDLSIKSNAQSNAVRFEINKMISHVETLLDGQTVIREDLAENKEKSSKSFRDIHRVLDKIMGNIAKENVSVAMIRNQRENADKLDVAEISTRLDSHFENSKLDIQEYSNKSSDLNRSYYLWDLASKGLPRKPKTLFKQPGGSTSTLPKIHTSTPKIVGVVMPNVSFSTEKQENYGTKKSEAPKKSFIVPPSINNMRSNKRTMIKKQRFLRDGTCEGPSELKNALHNKAGMNETNMRYTLRSTAKAANKPLVNVSGNKSKKIGAVSDMGNEPKSDDNDDMFG